MGRLIRDAERAVARADGDARCVTGRLTDALAADLACEPLRVVAKRLSPAPADAAEAVGALREAREASERGDSAAAEALARRSLESATCAHVGCDAAMDAMPPMAARAGSSREP